MCQRFTFPCVNEALILTVAKKVKGEMLEAVVVGASLRQEPRQLLVDCFELCGMTCEPNSTNGCYTKIHTSALGVQTRRLRYDEVHKTNGGKTPPFQY